MTLQITAAYNFVPLAKEVVYPEWQDLVSHDVPLKDGLCAELEVELTAHTPLLVGGTQKKATSASPGEVSFHRLPDGRYAIPGSSIRGMLRNVLEIATHARLATVMDDRALSLRDLTRDEYVNTLVDSSGLDQSSKGASPRTRAGWLWFDGASWRVQKASAVRVQQDEIKSHFGLDDASWPAYSDRAKREKWRPDAHKKRQILLSAHARNTKCAVLKDGHLLLRFEKPTAQPHKHRVGYLNYACIHSLIDFGGGNLRVNTFEGALVCTGQPGPSKHMEFVFSEFSRHPASLTVMPHVLAAFHQVHADDSGDWKKLWEGLAARGTPVPVFFLMDAKGEIERMGLTQMFRLPGKHTLGQLAERQQQPMPGRLDFVQTLFGHVLQGQPALKGRINVGDFTPVPGTVCKLAEGRFQAPTVLSSPKPGFYPNYFKQELQKKPNEFSTILSDDAPQLRGWKRYPVHPLGEVGVNPPPPKSGPSVQMRLQPLAQGCTFSGVIRLHNVRPEELGALLWALDFGQPATNPGDAPALRHALGLGKPFGFGQVSLRLIKPPAIRPNDSANAALDASDAVQAFERYMTSKVPNWKNGDTLSELRAMANPKHSGATKRNLTPPSDRKAFVLFKSKDSAAALKPYSQMR